MTASRRRSLSLRRRSLSLSKGHRPTGDRSGWLAVPLLLLAVAWNLRTVLAIVGASASQIEAELGSGGAVTGAVSTVFVLCAALAAPLASTASRRWNPWLVGLAGLSLIAFAHGLLWIGDLWWIWVAVGAGGAGAGLIGALTPALVAALLPDRAGLGIAVFMVGGSLGFYAASLSVPWSTTRGLPWTAASGLLGFVALSCAVAWLVAPSARRARTRGLIVEEAGASADHLVAPDRSARWMRALVAFLCVQSLSVFALIAWVAPSAEAAGATPTASANMLGLLSALQVISGVAFPMVAQRLRCAGALLVVSGAGVLLGSAVFLVLVVHLQQLAGGWLAVGLMALGHGGSFAMANFIVAARSRNSDEAVRFGAHMMLWSQLAGAAGPLLLGALRDLGGYPAMWWALTLIGGLQVACALVFTRWA